MLLITFLHILSFAGLPLWLEKLENSPFLLLPGKAGKCFQTIPASLSSAYDPVHFSKGIYFPSSTSYRVPSGVKLGIPHQTVTTIYLSTKGILTTAAKSSTTNYLSTDAGWPLVLEMFWNLPDS